MFDKRKYERAKKELKNTQFMIKTLENEEDADALMIELNGTKEGLIYKLSLALNVLLNKEVIDYKDLGVLIEATITKNIKYNNEPRSKRVIQKDLDELLKYLNRKDRDWED